MDDLNQNLCINTDDYRSLLCTLRDSLDNDIKNIYKTTLKDDDGSLDIYSDPMQTKSFARGRSIGLLIAKDRINGLLTKL